MSFGWRFRKMRSKPYWFIIIHPVSSGYPKKTKDITDRLIQVGHIIIKAEVIEHLIILPISMILVMR